MENTEEIEPILQRIPEPAFLVTGGTITAVNAAAKQLEILPGEKILPMLRTGQEDYLKMPDGTLYLSAKIAQKTCSLCIYKVADRELFVIEQDTDEAELRSMALAAKVLRTSLSNVMSIADRMFPMPCIDESPEAQYDIAKLNKGLFQMMRTVCNMSDAYRYGNETELHGEIRDITALVREFFQKSAPLVAHTGIDLTYDIPETPIYTLVDTEKLERALGNILSNALKFTVTGGTVEAKLTQRGRMVYITVHDSGNPNNPPPMQDLYSQYRRQPGIEDRRFGIGLGMVLIRQAATLHGGTVLMERSQAFGLRLTISLAIRSPQNAPLRSPVMRIDYAGEKDHLLIELSETLPAELYLQERIN